MTTLTSGDAVQTYSYRLSVGRVRRKINKVARKVKRWRLRRCVALTGPSPEANHDLPFSPHCLTCHDDLLMAVCSAKSLNLAMEEALPWIFHDDGSLTMADKRFLRSQFPGCRLVERSEADDVFKAPHLHSLAQARRKSVLLLKLADLHVFARRERILYVDSDILFFKRPDALLRALTNENGSYFTKDITTAYVAPLDALETLTGVRPLERVNSGIFVLNRGDIGLDTLADKLLKIEIARTVNRSTYNHLIEQTLVSILTTASVGGATHLPQEYDLCLERGLHDAVCRHYVGVIREFFELEGLQALLLETDFLSRWRRFAVRSL